MLRYLMMTLIFWSKLPQFRPGLSSGYQPPSSPPSGRSASGEPSGLAYATLALGIASWVILPVIGAVAGAIMGWIELKNIESGKSPAAGKTVTTIGFWLSVVNVGLVVIGTCLSVKAVVLFFGSFAALMAAAGFAGA